MELPLAQINGSNPFPEEDTGRILSIANYTFSLNRNTNFNKTM